MQLRLASSAASVHERAMAGIGFMDRNFNGWRAKIDRQKLNIMSDCGCVIGQVTGSFNKNHEKLFGDLKKAADLGFFAYSRYDGNGGVDEYRALTRAWLDILAAEDAVRRLASRQVRSQRRAMAA